MSSSALAKTLQNIDQFRVVSRDLTRGTFTGGLFTTIAYALLLLLLLAEIASYMRQTWQSNVTMDENEDQLVQLHFDITVFDLPCKYLKVGVWDKYGQERLEATEAFHYHNIDHQGNEGAQYSPEEIKALEQVDAVADASGVSDEEKKELDADWASTDDHFKHNDFHKAVTFHDFTLINFFAEWCVHCRNFAPQWVEMANRISEKMTFADASGNQQVTVKLLKVNCVAFQGICQQARVPAFPNIRLYKRDGTFEQFSAKRNAENIISFLTNSIRNSHMIYARHHNMFKQGCEVHGNLQVPRVPGHFHLEAKPHGEFSVNPALTNVSHRVNHLSFGDRFANGQFAARNKLPFDMMGHLSPLDGKSFVVEQFHQAPQHYLKVVSTHIEGSKLPWYQISHADRVRKLDPAQVPQARFTYDFSPMAVRVKATHKPWYAFLTSLFAILGGTYTIMELTSGAVDTVSTAVKEALGKKN